MKKTGLMVGLLLVAVGILGLLMMVGVYFLNYGSFVASPDSSLLQPNTSWMGGGMMGNGGITGGAYGMNIDLLRNMMTSFAKSKYESSGEKIYLTSVDGNDEIITPVSGMGSFAMMSNMMRPISCANCHGIDGKGGFLFPDNKTSSADIRWEELAKEGFDEAKFKKAVTEGVNEKGERLSVWMPRWDISDKNLAELIAYLKTL
ncbi:MAG: cytochrome c [Actinomycetota bacterium]